MSATFEHTTVPASGVFARVEQAFETALTRYRASRRRAAVYNQIMGELSRLDDRNLADLGISRHDIARIAKEGAQEA